MGIYNEFKDKTKIKTYVDMIVLEADKSPLYKRQSLKALTSKFHTTIEPEGELIEIQKFDISMQDAGNYLHIILNTVYVIKEKVSS